MEEVELWFVNNVKIYLILNISWPMSEFHFFPAPRIIFPSTLSGEPNGPFKIDRWDLCGINYARSSARKENINIKIILIFRAILVWKVCLAQFLTDFDKKKRFNLQYPQSNWRIITIFGRVHYTKFSVPYA